MIRAKQIKRENRLHSNTSLISPIAVVFIAVAPIFGVVKVFITVVVVVGAVTTRRRSSGL